MSLRSLVFLLLGGMILALGPAVRAEEDEPEFFDKKLSYWLKELEDGKEPKARRRGILALEQIGHDKSKKVVPALVKSLREDKEPVVRTAAARAIGRAVAKVMEQARAEKKEELPRFDTARDALATALRTEKAETVREAAAIALGDIGPDARGAVGTLALALKDKHVATVKAAVASLRRMGKDGHDAQAELQQLLADKKADVEARTDAAICLGQIRPDIAQALPVLKEVLADESADTKDGAGNRRAAIRRAVAEAVGKLGKEAAGATATLGVVLTAENSPAELRLAAVTALDEFGPDGKDAIPALIKAVGDASLIKAMGDSARFIRCLAMHALGRMGKDLDKERRDAVKVIIKASDDSNVEVCVSAIETLGALAADGFAGEGEEVVKKLDTILQREGRKVIREAAQATLDKIKPKKK